MDDKPTSFLHALTVSEFSLTHVSRVSSAVAHRIATCACRIARTDLEFDPRRARRAARGRATTAHGATPYSVNAERRRECG